jgi:murein DD-endopeptidase MepM/ murein hydrolase activator NlpD
MMTAWIAAFAVAAVQGQAVLVALPAAAGEVAAELIWQDQRAPLLRRDDRWLALIGVDLDVAPGDYDVSIRYTLSDGAVRSAREVLSVAKGQYPETRLEVEQRYVDLSPEDAQRAARESRHIAEIYELRSDETDWLEPFAAPLPGVAGGRNFGHRRFFNGQPRDPHSGADLRAAEGTTVFAANGGRIVLAENLFFSGNAVFIDHGAGIISVYLHLSRIDVSVGERVEQGEPIGLAGATGRVTGPHLHWGIRVLDARVDPFTLPGMPGR